VTVRIEWNTPTSDWDMKVFVDSNGDGSSVGETQQVGASARGPTDSESTTFAEPFVQPGQQYVVRVINFAATEPYDGQISFAGPEFQPAQTEQWTLNCELPEGNVIDSQQVLIARGEVKTVGFTGACASGKAAAKAACKTAPTVKGTAKRDKLKGTPASDVIAAKGGKDLVKSGKGDDVICLGRGRDKGKAGSGGDIVLGNGGADTAAGGAGGDELYGNRSRDLLKGGPGKDTCKGGPGKDETRSC
jgi:RTX calcium-binding nonapeptide repeat (4 copies)